LARDELRQIPPADAGVGLVDAMAGGSSYDNQVRLYALADPAAFTEQDKLLNRFIFNALKIAPNNRYRLNIAPSSGWLEFTAMDQLWNARTAPTLPSRDRAIAIAASYSHAS
jgi:hypothetical protein